MQKQILILAKSFKYSGFCVAGIDLDTNRYVRLVSNEDEEDSIKAENCIYDSNKYPISVLDVIKCHIIKSVPIKHQTENLLLDIGAPKEKIRTAHISELYDFLSDNEILYGNDKGFISNECVDGKIQHSIEIIMAKDIDIYETQQDEKTKIKVDFTYKNQRYKKLSLTDPVYLKRVPKHIDNGILVITLPKNPVKDIDLYYKIVATIFEVNEKNTMIEYLENKLKKLEPIINEYKNIKKQLCELQEKQNKPEKEICDVQNACIKNK